MSDNQETAMDIAERLSVDVLPCRRLPGCGPRVDGGQNHSSSCRASSRRAFVEAVAAAIEAAVGRERESRGRLIEDIRELVGLVYENPKAGWGKTQDEMLSWIRRFIEEQHQRVSGRELTLQAEVERLQADLAAAMHSLECIEERARAMKGSADGSRPHKSATEACAWIEAECIGVRLGKQRLTLPAARSIEESHSSRVATLVADLTALQAARDPDIENAIVADLRSLHSANERVRELEADLAAAEESALRSLHASGVEILRLRADLSAQRKNVETAEGAAIAMRAELEMFKEMHADVETASRLLQENNRLLADLAVAETKIEQLADAPLAISVTF